MKKITLYTLSLAFLLASPLAFSAPDAMQQDEFEEVQETPAQIKKRLSENVQKKDNGDVFIEISSSSSMRQGRGGTPSLLRTLISYVLPTYREMAPSRESGKEGGRDFNSSARSGSGRESGGGRPERPEGGKSRGEGGRQQGGSSYSRGGDSREAMSREKPSINITEILKTLNESLSQNKMSIKNFSYSQGPVQLSLANGLPIFAIMKNDSNLVDAIVERSSQRPIEKAKMPSWKAVLKEKTQKKYNSTKETFSALLVGFNKDTKEYLLQCEGYGSVWLTESELKLITSSMCQMKF